MQIQPATASLVGETSTVWSQIISLPGVYLLVELLDTNQEYAIEKGNRLMSSCMDKLRVPPVSLVETEQFVQSLSHEGVTSAILLVVVGAVAYIAQYGDCASYIKRNTLLARLVTGPGSISGELKQSDTLLLVTEHIKTILDETQLTTSFDHLPAADLAEKLTLLLHEKVEHFYGAGFIYHVSGFIEDTFQEDKNQDTQMTGLTPVVHHGTRDRFLRVAKRIKTGRWPTFHEIHFRFQHAGNDSKKMLMTVTVCLILLFGFSVFLGVRKIATSTVDTKLTVALTDAQHAFDEGVALRDLNPLKSRERLKFAKETLAPYTAKISKTSKLGRDVTTLFKSINDNLTLAMQITKVKPELFYDISLIKQQAKATYIAANVDTLTAVDATNGTVYGVTIASKNGQLVAGGDYLTQVQFSDNTTDNVYAFTPNGIYVLPFTGKATKQPIIKKDDSWGTIGGFLTFGGNLYLLDTQKNRIWKYVASETGFSTKKEYLTPDTLPDFSKATNFAIDGSVWIGSTNGKILKFSQGLEQTFEPQGVEPPLGQTLFVSTQDQENNLYILDVANKRVVVLNKDGLYVAQYTWDSSMSITSFAVSESQKKVLLLSQNLIYSFDLK